MDGWRDHMGDVGVDWGAMKPDYGEQMQAYRSVLDVERDAECEWRDAVVGRLAELEEAGKESAKEQKRITYVGWLVSLVVAIVGGAVGGLIVQAFGML